MNIFLISRGIPSKRDPQWGSFEKDQAEALAAFGHEVVVVSVDSKFRLYWKNPGISHSKINGIDYYDIFVIPGVITRKLGGARFNLYVKKYLLEKLYKKVVSLHGEPDIIYSHYLTNTYLATFIRKKYHVPVVAVEHWSKMMYPFSPHLRKIISYSYGNVDKLITVSRPLKDRIYTEFKKDSVVIPNMLGQEFLNYKERKLKGNKVNFISIGSLIQIKSYDILITAFSKLDLPRDKWHLTIIGDGSLKNSLLEQVKSCGLESNITFEGRKTKEEIVEFLSDSDVFILASKSETFGVVYIEALSQGLPCIATQCGGPEDIINESNGLLVPVGDIESLQDAICYMLENHSKYDRLKIIDCCRAHFSPDVISKQLLQIFEQTIMKYKEKLLP